MSQRSFSLFLATVLSVSTLFFSSRSAFSQAQDMNEKEMEQHQNYNPEMCRWESQGTEARCYISFPDNEELNKLKKEGGDALNKAPEYQRRINVLLYNFTTILIGKGIQESPIKDLYIISNPVGEYARENLKIFHVNRKVVRKAKILNVDGLDETAIRKKMQELMKSLEPYMESADYKH